MGSRPHKSSRHDGHATADSAIRYHECITCEVSSPYQCDWRFSCGCSRAKEHSFIQILRCVVDFQKVKPVLKPKRLEWWTLLVASFMMVFSVTWFCLLETDRYGTIRAAFDERPWRNNSDLHENKTVDTKSKITCPFTGKEAHGTCPICLSIVSRDGYYHVSHLSSHSNMLDFLFLIGRSTNFTQYCR